MCATPRPSDLVDTETIPGPGIAEREHDVLVRLGRRLPEDNVVDAPALAVGVDEVRLEAWRW
jgi:hypothetical protein